MTTEHLTTADGVRFRDLDHDGVMAPFEDPRLAPEDRVADLLPRLSVEEKSGLLFHTIIGGDPDDHDSASGFGPLTVRDAVSGRMMNHFNLHVLPSLRETARWQNAVQALAARTPHSIPVSFSSDPRHAFAENSGVAFAATSMSQWPEPLGLAALRDPERVRRFADVVRQEYRAIGLRAALHPQVDLATEARWGRQAQTFGQDAALSAELVTAYLEGLQTADLREGVGATTKHFPGGGPQRDGEDPHFPYGREQVYPGGRFEEHLEPFRAAIATGTSAMMLYYGMPVGLELDGEAVPEVGFAFNGRIVRLLREELGYEGIVLTDWGLITDVELFGKPFPARAWGVEDLAPIDRMARILEAGADQFGGEDRTDLLLELVASGRVPEARLDEAARRVLLVKFQLGLFDDPFVDEDAVESLVGTEEFRREGHVAQAESMVLLRNAGVLPLASGTRVHVDGLDAEVVEAAGLVPSAIEHAEVALLRLAAPFEPRDHYFLEAMFHQGSLEFAAGTVEHVLQLARRLPTIVDVALDRPAVLTPFADALAGLTVSFGTSDRALLDAWTGRIAPLGRLPFELPRSMAAVEASRPDVPSDTTDPLYPYGAGLT